MTATTAAPAPCFCAMPVSRCGECPLHAPTFERILDLEATAHATQALGAVIVGDSAAVLRRDRERLFGAVMALPHAQLVAFGEYRARHGR